VDVFEELVDLQDRILVGEEHFQVEPAPRRRRLRVGGLHPLEFLVFAEKRRYDPEVAQSEPPLKGTESSPALAGTGAD
jgi:hypothetical protein